MLSDSFQSESDSDFVGIRRNPMKSESDPTRILSDSDEFRRNPGRIPTERNPTTTVSDPIGFLWKMSDSDEIRLGSDRFRLDLQIGLNHLGIGIVASHLYLEKNNFGLMEGLQLRRSFAFSNYILLYRK